MFRRLRLRIQDMRTLSKLITAADKLANELGENEPGAEHFLLSALQLPDGTAWRVFERLGADPDDFQMAITKQYVDALNLLGIKASIIEDKPEPVTADRILHNSKPSGQLLIKQLYELKKQDKDRPLLSAHIIQVIAKMKHGVAARSLQVMGIDIKALYTATNDEIRLFHD